MSRSFLLLVRLCVIASAVAMLLICVRGAHAQDFSAAPQGSVYGYNPGQGAPHTDDVPAQAPAPYIPAPQLRPDVSAQSPETPAPTQFAPQQTPAAYGYHQGYAPAAATATNYGTQAAADPQAYYQQPASGNGVRGAYQLGPGDKIRVTVFGESDLSGEYEIDGSGVVRLPLIGTLQAAGATAPALENRIAATLAQGYLKQPRVNVEIATYRPFYIVGAVTRPGQYAYVDHMNALNAVALAGGFTDQARQSSVFVRHEGSATEEEVATDDFSHIRPGDVIRVKTTLFWEAMDVFTPLAPAAIAAAAIRP